MSSGDKTFIVEVEYFSGTKRYFTFDTRQDARDFARSKRGVASIFGSRILPAKRGPSNTKVF